MSRLVPPHGGYRKLKSFQNAEIVFDLTFIFVKKYISAKSRTRDQMEQAARSGKQNIGEGSKNSATSKQTELRLLNVARGSLEELLLDYEDFLRMKNLPRWDKNDPRVLEIRKLVYQESRTHETYMTHKTHKIDEMDKTYFEDPESFANSLITLINQTNYLLDRQIKSLEEDLLKKGDFKDHLSLVRKKEIQGLNFDMDKFLARSGMERLENGRVIPLKNGEKEDRQGR